MKAFTLRAFSALSIGAITLLQFFSCTFTSQNSDYKVLTGATIYDGTASDPVYDGIVVINDQRIECIGESGDCKFPEDSEVTNLNGRFITPGIVDAHVHFFQTGFFDSRPDAMDITETYPFAEVAAYQKKYPQRYYNAYLCSGITAVYDVGGMSWSIDLQDHAEQIPDAPHVAAAGPLLTPVPGAPFDLPSDKVLVQLDSEETGIKTVQYLSELGSTGIKFWQLSMDPDYLQRVEAAAEEIKKRDNQMIAHATTLEQAKAALRNGTRLLVHSVADQEVDEEFIELARENGTYYNPTLIVGSGYLLAYRAAAGIDPLEIDDPAGCVDQKTRKLIESASRFSDHPRFSEAMLNRLRNFNPDTDRVSEVQAANLRKLHEAGIPVVVGTDAGNPGTLHGISIFEELEAMQNAGIPAEDLIVMATKNGAKSMRRFDDFGTLEAGKFANLVILNQNPADDISNMRSRTHVMIKGVLKEI